jgi:hypothetical protein
MKVFRDYIIKGVTFAVPLAGWWLDAKLSAGAVTIAPVQHLSLKEGDRLAKPVGLDILYQANKFLLGHRRENLR